MLEFSDLPRGLPASPAASGLAPRALWNDPGVIAGSEFWTYETNKLFIGKSADRMIGIQDNRHLMTIAGSRAGKGTSAIIPNLLTYPGSVMVIDPKGENATLTAERRGRGDGISGGGLGHDVYIIDPFGVADVPDHYRAGFNPFEALDSSSDTFIDECDSVADALIVSAPGKADDHWNGSARLVLRGFIAWIASTGHDGSRDLNELRRLLYLPPELNEGQGFDDVIAIMANRPDVAHGIPAEMAGMLLGMGDDEMGSVLSTVRQNIAFLSSPAIAKTLSSSERHLDLRKWKDGYSSVYLCLPSGRLHRHKRFFRLYINQLLNAIEAESHQPDIPALMILDEMHVLGHMTMLATAVGLMAGYGVRIWSIWQDLNQLKDLYRTRWETFMGNSGVLQFFGLNDMTSLKYVSERLGQSSIMSISKGEISEAQLAAGYSGESKTIQQAPLLTPEEVAYYFSRQSNNQLIFYPGADPIFAQRVPYWDEFFGEYTK